MASMETPPEVATGHWKHGLFSCFGNIGVCIVTYLVPCYAAGKVAEAVGHSCPMYGLGFCVPILNVILGIAVRQQIRERQSIQGTFVSDLVVVLCCPCCALIQEANETGSGLIPQSISRH